MSDRPPVPDLGKVTRDPHQFMPANYDVSECSMNCGLPADDDIHIGNAASPRAEDALDVRSSVSKLSVLLDEILAQAGVADSDNPHSSDRVPRVSPSLVRLLQQADDLLDALASSVGVSDDDEAAKAAAIERGRVLAGRLMLASGPRAEFDGLVDWALTASDDELGAGLDAAKHPPNLAPYKVVTRDGQIVVVNNAGEVKAKFGKDRQAAVKYLRALYVNVKGAPGKADKKAWTGKQKRAS